MVGLPHSGLEKVGGVAVAVGYYTGMRAHKRMQLAARSFWSATAASRPPFELRAGVGGFVAGRRTVYGWFTAGIS